MRPSTVAVVAGRPSGPGAALGPPVELTSTYRDGGPVVYGRYGNASWAAFEAAVGALEGGDALAFSSGMGAVAAVIETLPAGAVVVAPYDAYSGTRQLLDDLASRGRLAPPRYVDVTDTARVLDACEGAALLWVESPTNPLLAVADVAALCSGARGRGVPVAVDNTFATPLVQRPLDLGADVVVHSATKFLAGHSDVVMGVAVTRDEAWRDALQTRRSLHGGIPGPFEAWLALRGLRTLAVRLERASASAAELARRLSSHAGVERVRYPGFGAMVSFDVRGGEAAATAVESALRLIVVATSLGGVETLLERRAKYSAEEVAPPNLLRMSVGLEDVEDLWADLDAALRAAT